MADQLCSGSSGGDIKVSVYCAEVDGYVDPNELDLIKEFVKEEKKLKLLKKYKDKFPEVAKRHGIA